MMQQIIDSLIDKIVYDYNAYINGNTSDVNTEKSIDEIFNRYWVLGEYDVSDTFDNRLLKPELDVVSNFDEPAFWTAMRIRSIKGSVIISTKSNVPIDFLNVCDLQKEINKKYETLLNISESDKSLENKKSLYRPLTTLNRKEKIVIYQMGRMYQYFA